MAKRANNGSMMMFSAVVSLSLPLFQDDRLSVGGFDEDSVTAGEYEYQKNRYIYVQGEEESNKNNNWRTDNGRPSGLQSTI